ncbi:MAG TPA: MarR family transcriptional regulator [Stellaceae bacterium]|nr:MarR family transcriptional regulator [Stellaceae bacterium]
MVDPFSPRSRMAHLPTTQLDREDYRTLSDFRYLIRRFLEFSQMAAGRVGLTPRQHQVLLAIKGFPRDDSPTVGDLAERLRIQHHSAVELVDRLAEAGLIVRTHDPQDRRRVLLGLTETAEELLASLSAIHLAELHALRPALLEILNRAGGPPEERRRAAEPRERGLS